MNGTFLPDTKSRIVQACDAILRARFCAIRSLIPAKPKQIVFLKDASGKPTHGRREQDLAQAEFFANAFGSELCDYESVVATERRSLGSHLHATKQFARDVAIYLLKRTFAFFLLARILTRRLPKMVADQSSSMRPLLKWHAVCTRFMSKLLLWSDPVCQ